MEMLDMGSLRLEMRPYRDVAGGGYKVVATASGDDIARLIKYAPAMYSAIKEMREKHGRMAISETAEEFQAAWEELLRADMRAKRVLALVDGEHE